MNHAEKISKATALPRQGVDRDTPTFAFVGAGIASMAAAVPVIRDGDIRGCRYTVQPEFGVRVAVELRWIEDARSAGVGLLDDQRQFWRRPFARSSPHTDRWPA